MTRPFVWLQLEFPWIPYGFIPAVQEAHADAFVEALDGLGFAVATIRCDATDNPFSQLRDALDLPDYCGSGWDSIHDCLRDFSWPPRFALLLRGADILAEKDPKLFGEACAFFTKEFDERTSSGIQSLLVISGNGPAFHDPAHPSPDRLLDDVQNRPVALERRRRDGGAS